jgi:hypothetical protein
MGSDPYFQPVTRAELSEIFGREISRDRIAALREEELIAAGPRSPRLRARYAYGLRCKRAVWRSDGMSKATRTTVPNAASYEG